MTWLTRRSGALNLAVRLRSARTDEEVSDAAPGMQLAERAVAAIDEGVVRELALGLDPALGEVRERTLGKGGDRLRSLVAVELAVGGHSLEGGPDYPLSRPQPVETRHLDSARGNVSFLRQGEPRRLPVLRLLHRPANRATGSLGARGAQGRDRPLLRPGGLHRRLGGS